jgi:hypothetical protein
MSSPVERVLYRDERGRTRVAIVHPDGTVTAMKKFASREDLMRCAVKDSTDERAKQSYEKATGLPVQITRWSAIEPDGSERVVAERHEVERSEAPADLLATCTARAAAWLAKAIEGGMSAEDAAAYSAEFAKQTGELVAKRIVAQDPDAFEPVVPSVAKAAADRKPEGWDRIDDHKQKETTKDVAVPDAGMPQPGQPKRRHLEPEPIPWDTPAAITDAPSKSEARKSELVAILKSAGFESIGLDEQGVEHLVNDSWKSEAMVHQTDGFAIRSGFTGGIVAGITSADLMTALDEQ